METRETNPTAGRVLGYAPVRPAGRLRARLRGHPRTLLLLAVLVALALAGVVGQRLYRWRLEEDARAFNAVATLSGNWIVFTRPPTEAALRHAQRLPGITALYFEWNGDPDPGASIRLRGRAFPQVKMIELSRRFDADPWLKELSRPDTGFKGLTTLDLTVTSVTDAGLKELARTDTGLKGLTTLYLGDTSVTDAGVAELQRARPGLTIDR